ncbi:acyl-CoA dehydrogenase family protein [Aquella oligotrophica]|uniref:glutaryl-CoA dehydrogenase (ETF) n=1 Tax=Aquella oligotrophica TaxID=2067065 RepID=A0A2I7N5J9_9NEIS|nr:acyl-CoA dehydrogenase family protein [Aquella oligotrophica]AUR51747.1 acyl-CoA dehydrogenase [Aquella oligotrophica]
MKFNASFDSMDPLKLQASLRTDEVNIQQQVRDFANKELKPLIQDGFFNENQGVNLLHRLGELKIFGGELAANYGGPVISPVAYGLIAYELEKIDSGLRTVMSVMGSLAMKSIALFGSAEQKTKYLELLNAGKLVASFALTEPEHGSDIAGLETTAKKTTNGYLINGSKRWIGLAPYADIIITWARCDDNIVRAFIVEKSLPGLSITPISNKISLRVAVQGEIHYNNVGVDESSLLPLSNGLSSAFSCLNYARYGIAWGALGAAQACFEEALNYVKTRKAFGVPLAAKQLIQEKLAKMQIEIAIGLNACLQVGRLLETNQASFYMINLLKYNSTVKALEIARSARDMLGGNGILEDNNIMRHMVNLESVVTYEGTRDIHLLTLGRELTSFSAF